MEILVVNCNTSASMTESLVAAARRAVQPGTNVIGATPTWGVASAEGFYDSYISAAAVLDLLTHWPTPFDAVVMAGFGEHGREGARQLLDVPVVDITEAAAITANLLAESFGVVTTAPTSVAQIRHSLETAGLSARCIGIRSTGVRVLDLHADLDETVRIFSTAGRRLVQEGAEAIILGCAGLAGLEDRVQDELGVPVIDGVSAAVGLCEMLVARGLRTSKSGTYATPDPGKPVTFLAPVTAQV